MTTRQEEARRVLGAIAIGLGGLIVFGVLLAVIIVIVGAACFNWLEIGLDPHPREIEYVLERQMKHSQFGPRWTEDGASIVFQHGSTIYTVDSGGTKVIKWVPEGAPKDETFAFDFSPDVSQTPPRVVYSTIRHGLKDNKDYEIATAHLDGSNYRRLTNSVGDDVAPAWSPDGKRIAFISSIEGYGVHVMDADGSNVVNVGGGSSALRARPAWSPDGRHLAFRQSRFLHVVDTESYGTVNLGSIATVPAWSPDGAWIAAVSHTEFHLYVTRPDGSETRKVFTPDEKSQLGISDLSWSLDGSKLRFFLYEKLLDTNKRTLYQIGTDGSNLQEILEVPEEAHIAWSPDGSRMAVLTPDEPSEPIFGNVLLYVTRSDGSDRQVLVRVDSRRGVEAVPWRQ